MERLKQYSCLPSEKGMNYARKLNFFHSAIGQEIGSQQERFLDTSAGFTRADQACAYALRLAEEAGVKFVWGEKGRLERMVIDAAEDGTKVVRGTVMADGTTHEGDLVIVACA